MSIGPLPGFPPLAAGAFVVPTRGAETERALHEIAADQRQAASDRRAENSAGIAAADGEQHELRECGADGRRPWELQPPKQTDAAGESDSGAPAPCRASTDDRGTELDLTG